MTEVRLSEPSLGALERRYVEQCIESGRLAAGGAFEARLEREIARHLEVPPAQVVACASGTAALTLALLELEVGPGDEVVVPQLSYVAPANAAACLGARPVLAAVDRRSGLLDPAELERLLADRARARGRAPKAVIGVDLLGRVAPWESLLEIADAHRSTLIEDACEALGATGAGGRPAGAFTAISCLSFNGTKTASGGSGGALRLAEPGAADRARMRANHGRRPGRDFVHELIGGNLRISNLHAAVACAQMERLDELIRGRRRVGARYREAVRRRGLALDWLAVPPGTRHLDWLPPCLASDAQTRERILDACENESIEARPFFAPLHQLPPFRDCPRGSGAAAEDLAARGILLPSSASMSDVLVDRIVDLIAHSLP